MKRRRPKKYFIDQPFVTNVGNKIREQRTLKNISIEDLANECEIDYSQVSRMELGKVNFSISFLNKLAAALKIEPKDLIP